MKIITYIIIASFLYGNCVYALPQNAAGSALQPSSKIPELSVLIKRLKTYIDADGIPPKKAMRIIDEHLAKLTKLRNADPVLQYYIRELTELAQKAREKLRRGSQKGMSLDVIVRDFMRWDKQRRKMQEAGRHFTDAYFGGMTDTEIDPQIRWILENHPERFRFIKGESKDKGAGELDVKEEWADMIMRAWEKVCEDERELRDFDIAVLQGVSFSGHNSGKQGGRIYIPIELLEAVMKPQVIASDSEAISTDRLLRCLQGAPRNDILVDFIEHEYLHAKGLSEEEIIAGSREKRPGVYDRAVKLYRKYIVDRLAQIIQMPQISENQGLTKELTRIIKNMQEDKKIEISDVMVNRLLWLLDRSKELNIVPGIAEVINLILEPDYAGYAGGVVMAVELILLEEAENLKDRRIQELKEGIEKTRAGIVFNGNSGIEGPTVREIPMSRLALKRLEEILYEYKRRIENAKTQADFLRALELKYQAVNEAEKTNRTGIISRIYAFTAEMYYNLGNSDRALSYFLKAKEISERMDLEDIAKIMLGIAKSYCGLGRYAEAKGYLSGAVELCDMEKKVSMIDIKTELVFYSGLVCLYLGEYGEAEKQFKECMQSPPNLLDLGEEEKAEDNNHYSMTARCCLALLKVLQKKEYERGLREIDKVMKIPNIAAGDKWTALFLKGWIYYLHGKKEECRQQIEEALRYEMSDWVKGVEFMVDLFAVLSKGDIAGYKEYLEIIKSVNPGFTAAFMIKLMDGHGMDIDISGFRKTAMELFFGEDYCGYARWLINKQRDSGSITVEKKAVSGKKQKKKSEKKKSHRPLVTGNSVQRQGELSELTRAGLAELILYLKETDNNSLAAVGGLKIVRDDSGLQGLIAERLFGGRPALNMNVYKEMYRILGLDIDTVTPERINGIVNELLSQPLIFQKDMIRDFIVFMHKKSEDAKESMISALKRLKNRFNELGEKWLEAETAYAIGDILYAEEKYDEAREVFKQILACLDGLSIRDKAGELKELIYTVYSCLGKTCHEMGSRIENPENKKVIMREGVSYYRRAVENGADTMVLLINTADICADLGEYGELFKVLEAVKLDKEIIELVLLELLNEGLKTSRAGFRGLIEEIIRHDEKLGLRQIIESNCNSVFWNEARQGKFIKAALEVIEANPRIADKLTKLLMRFNLTVYTEEIIKILQKKPSKDGLELLGNCYSPRVLDFLNLLPDIKTNRQLAKITARIKGRLGLIIERSADLDEAGREQALRHLPPEDTGEIHEYIEEWKTAMRLTGDRESAYQGIAGEKGLDIPARDAVGIAVNISEKLSNEGRNIEALRLLEGVEKEVQKQDLAGAFYLQKGALYHRRGMFGKAHDCYQTALKLPPDTSDVKTKIWHNLVLLFWELDNISQAENAVKMAWEGNYKDNCIILINVIIEDAFKGAEKGKKWLRELLQTSDTALQDIFKESVKRITAGKSDRLQELVTACMDILLEKDSDELIRSNEIKTVFLSDENKLRVSLGGHTVILNNGDMGVAAKVEIMLLKYLADKYLYLLKDLDEAEVDEAINIYSAQSEKIRRLAVVISAFDKSLSNAVWSAITGRKIVEVIDNILLVYSNSIGEAGIFVPSDASMDDLYGLETEMLYKVLGKYIGVREEEDALVAESSLSNLFIDGDRNEGEKSAVRKWIEKTMADLLEKAAECAEGEGGGLPYEQLRDFAVDSTTSAGMLVDYIVRTGLPSQIRVITDALSSNHQKLGAFLDELSRRIELDKLIIRLTANTAINELQEKLRESKRWAGIISYLLKNNSIEVKTTVLSIIFDVESREDRERFILEEADRIVQAFNEDPINQKEFKNVLVKSISKFLEMETAGDYDIQQLLTKHLGLAYQFAQVAAHSGLDEKFQESFRNGYILLRAMEIISCRGKEEVLTQHNENYVPYSGFPIGKKTGGCGTIIAGYWQWAVQYLRKLLRGYTLVGEIEFVGPEIKGSTIIRKVKYKGKIYMAKYMRKNESEFEETVIIPQFNHLSELNKLGITGICRAIALIELPDGRKAILFEEFPPGQTLHKKIGKMPEKGAIGVIIKVAEIVKELYEKAGLFHWDIKPDNIWLTDAGEVILFDFDLAFKTKEEMTKRWIEDKGGWDYMSDNRFRIMQGYLEVEGGLQPCILDEIYALGMTLLRLVQKPSKRWLKYGSLDTEVGRLRDGPFKDIVSRALMAGENLNRPSYGTIDEFIEDLKSFKHGIADTSGNPSSSFSFPCCEGSGDETADNAYIGEPIKIGEDYLDNYSRINESIERRIVEWLLELHNRSYCLDEFSGLEIQILGGRFSYCVWRQGNTIFIGDELVRVFANVSKVSGCRDFGLIIFYMMLTHEGMHDGRLDGAIESQFYEELLAVGAELAAVRDNYITRYIFNMDSRTVLKILQNGWKVIDRWIPDFKKQTNVLLFNGLLFREEITPFDIVEAILLFDGRFREIRNEGIDICKKRGFTPPRKGIHSLRDLVGYRAWLDKVIEAGKKQNEEEKRTMRGVKSIFFRIKDNIYVKIPKCLRKKTEYFIDSEKVLGRRLFLMNKETGKKLFIQVLVFKKKITGIFIGDNPHSGIEYKLEYSLDGRGLFISRRGKNMGSLRLGKKGRNMLDLEDIKGNIFVDRFLKRKSEFTTELFLSLLKRGRSNTGKRTIIALDTNIGNMNKQETENLFLQIEDVGSLLGDVEFVYGAGETLAGIIEEKKAELTRDGKCGEEDIETIAVIKHDNRGFKEGCAVLRVDDTKINDSPQSVPILELVTFALFIKDIKASGVYGEDLKELYFIITGGEPTEEILEEILTGHSSIPLQETKKITGEYVEYIELLRSA